MPAQIMHQGQDWNTVSWNRPARPQGPNGSHPVPGRSRKEKKLRDLDRADEAQPVAKCSLAVSAMIQKGRTAKKMTQAQLAKQVNISPKVLQSYENGKASPEPALLNKLSRALGVKLSARTKPANAA